MRFQTCQPHRALRSCVRFYWFLEPDHIGDQLHRLLPGTSCDLIIHLGTPARYKIGEGDWGIRRPMGFIEGHFKKYFLLRFSGACRLAGIRFASAGLYPFVRTPLKEFTQQFVDLIDVFGKAGQELMQRVAETNSKVALSSIFDWFLLRQKDRSITVDIRLEQAVHLLFEKHGILPISRLIKELGVTERQLERAFECHVGISPERFAQTLRLSHFIRLAQKSCRPAFTQLAYECSYADQSHLIRAFKQHTGMTPGNYFRQEHGIQRILGDSYPTDFDAQVR